MALVRWIIGIAAVAVAAALAGTSLYVALHEPSRSIDPAGAIVVLGAGIDPETARPTAAMRARMALGADLYAAGAAPRVIVTGGSSRQPARAVAREVRAVARSLGLPDAALTVEAASLSTLQNALFTRDLIGDPLTPILLVTHRSHQPRALASFRWAGFGDIALAAPDADRPFALDAQIVREAVAWPVNLVRAALASAAMAADIPRSAYIALLE